MGGSSGPGKVDPSVGAAELSAQWSLSAGGGEGFRV